MKKILLTLAAALVAIVPMSAAGRVVVVRRPVYYGGGGFYRGGFSNPYWGNYWGPSFGYSNFGYQSYPNSGEVKLETKVKDAEVFINGAFAGSTHDNKTMHLRPGQYDIEIRSGGQPRFTQRVFVVAGKTLHLNPVL